MRKSGTGCQQSSAVGATRTSMTVLKTLGRHLSWNESIYFYLDESFIEKRFCISFYLVFSGAK